MARAVGIDIGSKSLKIIQLETSAGKIRVTHFFDLELSFGEDEQANSNLLIEAIHTIFKENTLDRNNVILSLPTQDSILREITVDFSQDEHIKKIIKYEAEKYLHSYPIEQVIIDYAKLNTDEKRSRLFVAAVPKVILSQRLGILETCGIDPISVDLDITAIANVAALCPSVMKREMVLIIDFGASATKLIFMNKNDMKHVRAIRLGANLRDDEPVEGEGKLNASTDGADEEWNDIDWDLESELIVTLPVPDGMSSDRMFLVHQSDGKEEEQQGQRKSEVFDRLVKEIRRTMLTLQLEYPIERICLTGGGSQLQGIAEFLKEKLKIDTTFLNYSSSISLENDTSNEVLYSGSVALGCALKGLGKNKIDMDFRKEEYAYTKRFEMMKFPIAVCVTIMLLLFLVMGYGIQENRITAQKKYNTLCNNAEKIYKRTLPSKRLPVRNKDYLYRILKGMRSTLADGDGELPPVNSAFQRWLDISKQFAEIRRRSYIVITELSIGENQGTIGGFLGQNDSPLDYVRRRINSIADMDPDKTNFIGNEVIRNPPIRELPREYKIEFFYRENDEEE
ncbi:pilus assembly protein PilM [Candidatus Uabimicrobium sp. HlEnr_7]|uniref:pilus assembly protein PilM n=1 Tax=Candidatus Uabimicrobium helgolandensis TaxID=3095367 RepID=UPI0035565A3D